MLPPIVNYSYLCFRLTRINHRSRTCLLEHPAQRSGSADYFFEITRSPVAVRALKQFRVTHLLGFQSSSTSTSAFLLFSCASGSRDQSPSNNHFPSGERLDRIRWTASLTRSSSPYPNFARTLRPCRAS